MTVTLSPLPPGKRFGVTFVDDTDLSTRDNTEPVYRRLFEHRLFGTKTVWPLRARRNSAFRRADERADHQPFSGSTLQDPDYLAFIRVLRAQGFEIALHGVAAGNSSRAEIEEGLRIFQEAFGALPAINAFHSKNVENLYCGAHKLDSLLLRGLEYLSDRSEYEGHREGLPSFWGDIARDTFRYVRLPFHTIDDVNTLALNPSMPFHDPRRPYVRRWFAASDGADVVRFNRLLSEPNRQRLVRDHGVSVVYTHFAKGFVRRRGDTLVLDDEFERTVGNVSRTPGGWFPTTFELLERLEALQDIAVLHKGEHLELKNTGNREVESATLRVPSTGRVTDADRRELERTGDLVALPRLEPGGMVRLHTSWTGNQVRQPSPTIDRRERRAIEYRNYIGLVRGSWKDRAHWRAATAAARRAEVV